MRIPPSSLSTTKQATPPPPKRSPTEAKPAVDWGSKTANVGQDVRKALNNEPGRYLFAELLENQINDPESDTGYVWDPTDAKAMQWTLRAQEVGDDSILVRVSGKELSILSESSGFEGKATFKGSSREALNKAVLEAVASLNRATEAERGR